VGTVGVADPAADSHASAFPLKLFAVLVVPWMVVLYLPAALCMWLDVKTNNSRGGRLADGGEKTMS